MLLCIQWRVPCECGWPSLVLLWEDETYCQVTSQQDVASSLIHHKWSCSVKHDCLRSLKEITYFHWILVSLCIKWENIIVTAFLGCYKDNVQSIKTHTEIDLSLYICVCVCVCVCVCECVHAHACALCALLSHPVLSDSLQPHGL